MISKEEFDKHCSYDISYDYTNDETQVVCIFSAGFLKEFPDKFYKERPEVAKSLVLEDLYNYVNNLLEGNNG